MHRRARVRASRWSSVHNRWTWLQVWRKRSPPAEARGCKLKRRQSPGGGYESSSTLGVDPTRRAGNSRKTLLNECCQERSLHHLNAALPAAPSAPPTHAVDVATSHQRSGTFASSHALVLGGCSARRAILNKRTCPAPSKAAAAACMYTGQLTRTSCADRWLTRGQEFHRTAAACVISGATHAGGAMRDLHGQQRSHACGGGPAVGFIALATRQQSTVGVHGQTDGPIAHRISFPTLRCAQFKGQDFHTS